MADDFDTAFAAFQQALIDLDGDGQPDAVVVGDMPAAGPRQIAERVANALPMPMARGGAKLGLMAADAADYITDIPRRAGELSAEAAAAGGYDRLDPSVVGQTAFDVGTLPSLGAVAGGVPRNALAQGAGAATTDLGRAVGGAAIGAGAGGAGLGLYTMGRDMIEGDFGGLLNADYMAGVGRNALMGAAFGAGVVPAALGARKVPEVYAQTILNAPDPVRRLSAHGRAADEIQNRLLSIRRAAEVDPDTAAGLASAQRGGGWPDDPRQMANEMVLRARRNEAGVAPSRYADVFERRVAEGAVKNMQRRPKALPAPKAGEPEKWVDPTTNENSTSARRYETQQRARAAFETSPAASRMKRDAETDRFVESLAQSSPADVPAAIKTFAKETGQSVRDVVRRMAESGYNPQGLISTLAYQGRAQGRFQPLSAEAREVLQAAREATGKVPFSPYRPYGRQ